MRFDNLDEWLAWQATLHPKEIDLGLDRITTVWQRLSSASLSGHVISVAGTNGKGSCVAYLEAILRAASYRVGCYTSPHLVRYNERIVIDGRQASDQQICQVFERIDQARGDIELTYFEFGTLAALELFREAELDVVVLEVGLGGRLDAVNIVDSDVALITTVDIDHTDWLGDTREQIGYEKAGIMRQGRPVVFGGRDIPRSVREHADALGARLLVAGEDYSWRRQETGWEWLHPAHSRHSLPLPAMRGEVQLRNAAAALMVLDCLRNELPLDQRAVRFGLQEAALAGRFQVAGQDPLLIFDVAHNAEAAATLASNLGDIFSHGKSRAVFSMLDDKEIGEVVRTMRKRVDEWYLFPLRASRAASVERLQASLLAEGVEAGQVHCHDDAEGAYQAALQASTAEDRVVVFGSFYSVGDLLRLV
ncbi:MAG: bifunctional tetrahydrofolate synthase/dihydrofolate synthase [Sedimenticola sp.]|nr:bifunctional tetrahydrofolate synthase/dihydrofolate synthase [Sedimenticola sp.]